MLKHITKVRKFKWKGFIIILEYLPSVDQCIKIVSSSANLGNSSVNSNKPYSHITILSLKAI